MGIRMEIYWNYGIYEISKLIVKEKYFLDNFKGLILNEHNNIGWT